MSKFIISDIKVSIVKTQSAGADYTDHAEGHWINDSIIANPMSRYPEYQVSRSKWGMDAIKGIFIEVFTEDGQKGFATAFGAGSVAGRRGRFRPCSPTLRPETGRRVCFRVCFPGAPSPVGRRPAPWGESPVLRIGVAGP